MIKVYKKHSSSEAIPYMDNCYISETPRNELDVEFKDLDALTAFFKVNQIDYIQFRNICKSWILPDWESLSEMHKRELVFHNIAPSEEIKLEYFTVEELIANYILIVTAEVIARTDRWKQAMSVSAFKLGTSQLARLSMYNDAKVFKDDYIDADLPHLICWLTSTAYPELGIDFTANGFASKWYYTEDIKLSALQILTK